MPGDGASKPELESSSDDRAAGDLRIGSTFAGKYEVRGKLGEGGFGAVYLVTNDVGWELALKLLHPEVSSHEVYRKRFLREMNLARELLHENAVPVRDAGEDLGRLYYTMDLVRGSTVAQILKDAGKVPLERAVHWGCEVLAFLEFLHGKGYIHRDLKPANLMVETTSGRERVRVLDLGIARSIAVDQAQTALTGGMVIGTLRYMAPEQILGDALDHRIDLYALGVTLYECISGRKPLEAETQQELIRVICTETPRRLAERVPGVPRALSDAIGKALAKKPADRFADSGEFRRALERLRSEGAAPASFREARSGRAAPWPGYAGNGRKRRVLAWTGGALLLALAGGIGWVFNEFRVGPLPVSVEEAEPRLGAPSARDSTPPRVVEATPPAGADVTGSRVDLVITADEPLSESTRIESRPAAIAGFVASSTIEVEEFGVSPIYVELVDSSGNVFAFQHPIQFHEPLAPPPEFRILSPAHGALVSGEVVDIAIEVSSPGSYAVVLGADGEVVPIGDGGVARHRWRLRVKDGIEEIPFRITAERTEGAFGTISVRVDNQAPQLVRIEPPNGTLVEGEFTAVEVLGDEALGHDTSFGSDRADVADRVARGRVRTAEAEEGIDLRIVDLAGNARLVPYRLERFRGRVPDGLEAFEETRPDPFGLGLATPVREPRTGLVLVLVPPTPTAGFRMGASDGDLDAEEDERPAHDVVISRPFYLGRTEVQRKEWALAVTAGIVPELPGVDHWHDPTVDDAHPIVWVRWSEARRFCQWLGMDLPAEAQWEWACRHGAGTARYPWGDEFDGGAGWANVLDISGMKWAGRKKSPASFDDGYTYTAPGTPGAVRATSLGLYHMTGNVLEWCRDIYVGELYASRSGRPVHDPVATRPLDDDGPISHVLRGGAFKEGEAGCRISRRWKLAENAPRYDDVGFRVYLEVPR